jgi:tetratricopeptide (TPR) repeat protein
MILRISDSISRALGVIAACLIAAVMSYFACRMALGAIAAEGQTTEQLRAATRWEPRNSVYWYLWGHFEESNMERPDPVGAASFLQTAVLLNPLYTDAWLELANTHELEGDLDEARRAYIHAEQSYPSSAEVAWRYGNFLLRTGDLPDAFAKLRSAVEKDPQFAAAAYSRVYRADPNQDDVLEKVLPPIPRVYVAVIAEATAAKQLAFAQIVWARLLALKPKLQVHDFDNLVYSLAADSEYAMAQRIWNQGASTLSLPPLLQQQGSLVWDPSFESGVEGATFSWHYQPLDQGVQISLDSNEKHSGGRSLRFAFDGKHNPGGDLACTWSAVNSVGQSYHFSAWIKAREVTTQQGLRFRITSLGSKESSVSTTQEFHGGLPWTLVEMPWMAGKDVYGVRICVSRDPSDNPDVRISGSAWVDDVNLVPDALEPRRP